MTLFQKFPKSKTKTGKLKKFSHRAIALEILKHKNAIQMGTVLIIDPASISLGYCIIQDGKEMDAGELVARGPISQRLNSLHDQLEEVLKHYHPIDVLLIELVRTGTGSRELGWGAGNSIGPANTPVTIEIPFAMWKNVQDENYTKSDVNDARYIYKLAELICSEGDGDE